MHSPQNLQIVSELPDEGVLLVRVVLGLHLQGHVCSIRDCPALPPPGAASSVPSAPAYLDGAVKALKALAGDASIGQHSPVGPIVPIALQEGDEGLADGHIIRSGVVVQLLMPVLRRPQRRVSEGTDERAALQHQARGRQNTWLPAGGRSTAAAVQNKLLRAVCNTPAGRGSSRC